METKLVNSGDESSIVSKQERSINVFTENLHTQLTESALVSNRISTFLSDMLLKCDSRERRSSLTEQMIYRL